MSNEDGTPIHGALDPRLKVPVLVELDGRRLRVVTHVPRMDLQIAAWNTGSYRSYAELTLSDGTTFLVFHDLVSGGWLRIAPPDPAPDAR